MMTERDYMALEKERTPVVVRSARYTGPGMTVTDNQCPPDQVAVAWRGNGNVGWYSVLEVFPS